MHGHLTQGWEVNHGTLLQATAALLLQNDFGRGQFKVQVIDHTANSRPKSIGNIF